MRELLLEIYQRLFKTYGPQHWWPGESAFEVIVGAILTQNTSWANVEKAIRSLKNKGALTPEGIRDLKRSELSQLIKSSGYYRIKADRLKAFVKCLFKDYHGNLDLMKKEEKNRLRERLLRIKGIGPETADSILLYGFGIPVFVVDAYTRRILSRHGIISEKASYDDIQDLFMEHLPHEEQLFNEYHALLVRLGKTVCKKIPKCDICPLKGVKGSRIQANK